MIFHLVVVVLTLARTIQIKRRSGKDRTLTHVLIRDGKNISQNASNRYLIRYPGVVYFGYTLFIISEKRLRMLKNAAQSHQSCCVIQHYHPIGMCPLSVYGNSVTDSDGEARIRESLPGQLLLDSYVAEGNDARNPERDDKRVRSSLRLGSSEMRLK